MRPAALLSFAALVSLVGCTAPIAPAAPANAVAQPAVAAQAAPSTPAPPPIRLRLGINTPSAIVTPVWAAKEAGFFARQGLDVEFLTIPGGERVVAALAAGELDLTILASPGLVNAVLAGADLVFVGSTLNMGLYWFYAQPEFGSVSDLRGKRVAITGRAGSVKRATQVALARAGIDADRDTTLLAMGDFTGSTTALLTGAADAAVLQPPGTFLVEDAGLRQLMDPAAFDLLQISQGLAVTRGWLARNEEVTRRVLLALSEGVVYARQQREAALQIIGKYTQSDDRRLLERTYDAVSPAWANVPVAPVEAIQSDLEGLVADNPAAREAQAAQFVDNRLVESLQREGLLPASAR